MDKEGLKLPSEWEVIEGITVYDPDGWDRKDFQVSWNTPIDYDEWNIRMSKSTIGPLRVRDK